MSDLMVTDQPCQECRDRAAEDGADVTWWCGMFGCDECARGHHICGETRPA